MAKYLDAKKPLSLIFAIPDHPWVESKDGAAVRIAMTAGMAGKREGLREEVVNERLVEGDRFVDVELTRRRGLVHSDLSIGPAVTKATVLLANARLSYQGPILVGEGFRLEPDELKDVGVSPTSLPPVVHPYVIGRDIVQAMKPRFVIDLFGLSQEEARDRYPVLFQRVLDRVKPQRDQVARKNHRDKWWIFGEARPGMRAALRNLKRYVATVETSKFKPFVFLPAEVCPDHKLYAIASDDAFHLGVLSSRVHFAWAMVAGGHLGVGNDPTWTNTTCFLPFPFPGSEGKHVVRIRELAEVLDAHRKARQREHPELTLTGMYNVLEKLRRGEELTEKDKAIHEKGLVSVLKKIHADLDAAVLDAYGWPHDLTDEQIVERLVQLNAERAAEEKKGLIRWLRPEFQAPERAAGKRAKPTQTSLIEPEPEAVEPPAADGARPWPKELADRMLAVRSILQRGKTMTARDVAKSFAGRAKDRASSITEVLVALRAVGQALAIEGSGDTRWTATGRR